MSEDLWFGNFSECCLDIKPEWELFLGPKATIPFPHGPGKYRCRTCPSLSGVDICAEPTDFLTNRRLKVVNGDPHPLVCKLTTQLVFDRDDVSGCVYPGCVGQLYDSEDEFFEEAEEDEEEEDDSDEGFSEKKDEGIVKLDLARLRQQKIKISDCVYLGTPCPSVSLKRLEPIIDEQVYCLKSGDEVQGYVFTVGIAGACLNRFHSDEGHYEVAVHTYNKGLVLLGLQNELNWTWEYEPVVPDEVGLSARMYWSPRN